MKSKEKHFAKYPVVIEFPIDWGDMDSFQHVNNIIYFRYFENARLAYFEKKEIILLLKEKNIGPILAETQCRFRAPLTYPDTISVATKTTEIKSDRFTMKYLIYSEKLKRIAATGSSVVVYYDYKEKCKADIPKRIVELITD